MRIARRHWAMALAGAVLTHGLVAAGLLVRAPETGARHMGQHGIEVSLGPAGGAPGGEARPVRNAVDADSVTPSEVEAAPVPEATEAVEAAAPAPTAPETPVMDAVQQPTGQPAIVEAVPVEPVEAVPVRTVEPAPVPPRRPPPKQKPAAERVAQAGLAATRPESTERPKKEPVAQAGPSSPPGHDGKAGIRASPNAGSGSDTTGGGSPGQSADYLALLQMWLEKHKEYPRRAQLLRQEGTALLYFSMNRDGDVLQYRLQRSSGHSVLDREVLEMIRRARPLPKMPDQMTQTRLELVVPVRFFLR